MGVRPGLLADAGIKPIDECGKRGAPPIYPGKGRSPAGPSYALPTEETIIESDDWQEDRPRTTDPLTGLIHRVAWEEQAPALLEGADAARVPVCLLLLDLDDFGLVNERYGQDEGDRILKEVAALWRAHVRHNDVVARVGPDEFAVLLIACSLEAASAVARRLCGLLDPDRVSASAGGSEWNGSETPTELLSRARAALDQARHYSGDRIEIASDVAARS